MQPFNTTLRYLSLLTVISLSFFSVNAEPVSPETLEEEWNFYGRGEGKASFRMYYMKESDDSKGVVLVSPEPVGTQVTMTYEIMPMTASSVCVAVVSASDKGDADTLTVPEDYDGSIGLWTAGSENYFFAFHNAAHNRPPFLRKFPEGEALRMTEKNVMRVGEFHKVVVQRNNERLSLTINGKTVIDIEDPSPLQSGHLAFRLRGIPGDPASCFIRNVTISTDDPEQKAKPKMLPFP